MNTKVLMQGNQHSVLAATPAAFDFAGEAIYRNEWQADHISDEEKDGQYCDIDEVISAVIDNMSGKNAIDAKTVDVVGELLYQDDWKNKDHLSDSQLEHQLEDTMSLIRNLLPLLVVGVRG